MLTQVKGFMFKKKSFQVDIIVYPLTFCIDIYIDGVPYKLKQPHSFWLNEKDFFFFGVREFGSIQERNAKLREIVRKLRANGYC